jgi:hypothetical protein
MANVMHAATAIERPITQMESQITRFDNAMEELEREVQNLIGALTAVLRAEPPSPAQNGAKVGEVLVPLAGHISGVTERLYALTAGINGARARLEL